MDPKENIEKLISEKEVQFRDFRLTAVETRKAEDGTEEMIVEGVACTMNQETTIYRGAGWEWHEIIADGAFASCDMTDVIFNYNHSGRVYARTRNATLEVWVEGLELKMRAKLRADDQGHKELHEDIKAGNIDRMSFAFHVSSSKWEYRVENNMEIDIRIITGIDKLYDVSAVDIPAYDTTSISARSQFSAVSEKRAAESRRVAEELELRKQQLLLLGKMRK